MKTRLNFIFLNILNISMTLMLVIFFIFWLLHGLIGIITLILGNIIYIFYPWKKVKNYSERWFDYYLIISGDFLDNVIDLYSKK